MSAHRFFAAFLVLTASLSAEQLTFRHAVELALKNGTTMAIAGADQTRAKFNYLEQRNTYLPQATIGSGVAYTNGFPLSIEGSAPSILSINSTQYLYNAAGSEFLKAAKTDVSVSNLSAGDKRAAVILETATVYRELDKLQSSINLLKQQEAAAQKVVQVSRDRLAAGVDSEVDVTRARLAASRVHLTSEQAQGDAEVLRLRLAHLTGLPAAGIETVTESIPRLPDVLMDEAFLKRALESNPAVKIADDTAAAKDYRAKGEHKMNYPAIDFAVQYGLFAKYNNYDEFFRKFQRNNITAGIVIRFPFLNFSQHARADAAVADAVHARKEAEAVKNQVETETMQLQKSVRQLAAARDVAKLEYQLASSDVQAMMARVEAGSATVRDLENARIMEGQRYSAYLDMAFQMERTQMQLLRVTGEIEKWAMGQ